MRGSSIGEDRSLVLTRTHGPTHELLTAGVQNISTDVKGNITFIPASLRPTSSSLTSVWDFDNRLNTADVGSDVSVDVTYKFDALGRRVFRDNGTTATIYVQAGQQTIADYTASSAPSSPTYRYVYASYIDEPVLRFKPSGSESLYYHRNQQYSVVALTNSSAAIVERYAYSAYGVPTITNASGTLLPIGSVDNRYLYTGREWDQTLSLYHYRARMYDANLGRFASRDPIGYQGGSLGLHEYVSSGPIRYADPLGLKKWGTNDFFNHYYHGWGRGVTLTETGLLDDFLKNVDAEIQQQFNDGFTDGKGKVHCSNGPGDYSETIPWKSAPGLYWESGLWPLGGTPVNVTRTTTVSWLCEQCECANPPRIKVTSLSINVSLDIHVHDAWTNPYRVWEGDDTDAAAANGECCYGCYLAFMEKYPYWKQKYDDCVTDCDKRFKHKGNGGMWGGGRPFGISEDIKKSKSFSSSDPCN